MSANQLLDKLVKMRQAQCEHLFQDRIVVVSENKVFCGNCGKEEEG